MNTSTSKRASRKKRVKLPENRQKRGGNPHPNPPPVEHQFKPGQSGNPGGRPKKLSEAYAAKLARLVPDDAEGRTYAEVAADAIMLEVIKGDVQAAKEIRAATEGDRMRIDIWQSEIVDQIKAGLLKPEEVIAELGADGARDILIAAGKVIIQSQSETTASDSSADATANAAA